MDLFFLFSLMLSQSKRVSLMEEFLEMQEVAISESLCRVYGWEPINGALQEHEVEDIERWEYIQDNGYLGLRIHSSTSLRGHNGIVHHDSPCWPDSQLKFLRPSSQASPRLSGSRREDDGRSFIETMHLPTLSLCVSLRPKTKYPSLIPLPYSTDLAPCDFFLFPKCKIV